MTTKCEQSPATAGELSKEEVATAERNATGADAEGLRGLLDMARTVYVDTGPLLVTLRETLALAKKKEATRDDFSSARNAIGAMERLLKSLWDARCEVVDGASLTPTSGPCSEERSPDATAEAWAKGVRAKEALVRDWAQQQTRARIAPTPVPTVPPLKPAPAALDASDATQPAKEPRHG
ncbi:hypothetical protein ACLEPN_37810 [Myxococcus sp. 1LA]